MKPTLTPPLYPFNIVIIHIYTTFACAQATAMRINNDDSTSPHTSALAKSPLTTSPTTTSSTSLHTQTSMISWGNSQRPPFTLSN